VYVWAMIYVLQYKRKVLKYRTHLCKVLKFMQAWPALMMDPSWRNRHERLGWHS
jgi:hypothetical protein